MEIVRINLESIKENITTLSINSIIEEENELLIKTNNSNFKNIHLGEKLYFIRYIYDDNNSYFTLSETVEVIGLENNVIHTTKLPKHKIFLQPGKQNVIDLGGNRYIIKCVENHNIFPQDIFNQKIKIKDYTGTELLECTDIKIPSTISDREVTYDDCVSITGTSETCGKSKGDITYYSYNFYNYKISRKSLIISTENLTENVIDNMVYFESDFNPFYYITEETDSKGVTYKKCNLYTDPWWISAKTNYSSSFKQITNNGNTRSVIGRDSDYFNLSVNLSNSIDEISLGSDDTLSEIYIDSVKQNLIPDFIDLEKIKYSPCVYSESGLTEASKISINLHFRERERIIVDDNRSANTTMTSGNVYYDSWHVEESNADKVWWNNMEYSGSVFSESAFTTFLTNKGEESDLIGYLNFTDNDIFYRKKKVSQSFLRLMFYNSNDAINQKLLFYSTVFLDSTELYSKYLKQLINIEENNIILDDENQNAKIVLFDDEVRLDTKLTITNEYDRNRSAEGFNIYLFASDVNFGLDENEEKTIYLKVEFNHAGNGKTIPMIMWPKENGKYVPLTIDNFISNLYIPIKISYFNNKYVYYIPDAYRNENGEIVLVLFEPKIDLVNQLITFEENG